MSGATHTPGPWRAFNWGAKVGVTGDLQTADIALCSGFDTRRSLDEEIANARLIAAAPDLLHALLCLKEWVEDHAMKPAEISEFQTALAAIAKAEGRTNA